MSVSAETYIVISLMFAVFAAVAAVGTSVVLGAGFERLRAGFEVVRKQSGFFADAIYKLDQRTQKLDEEASKLKGHVTNLGERVERVEKTSTFLADGINSLEQRILQGSPSQPSAPEPLRMREPVRVIQAVHTISQKAQEHKDWTTGPMIADRAVHAPMEELRAEMVMVPALAAESSGNVPADADRQAFVPESGEPEASQGFTTLLARYFAGEGSGGSKGVVYH